MSDKIEIVAVDARNFKRLTDVHVDATADRHLLLIAGKNAAGKSSLMDAITVALGGTNELPADPVRHGSDRAEIIVELSGGRGRYKVVRTIAGPGKSTLKITGPDGPMAKPQTWLDNLVAGRFLDPVGFLTRKPAEQRQALLAVVGVDVAALDAERKESLDERTAVGRMLTRAEGELQRLPPVAEKPAAARSQAAIRVDLDAIEVERRSIVDAQAKRREAKAAHEALEAQAARIHAEIDRMQGQLAALEPTIETARAKVAEATAAIAMATPLNVERLDARKAELVAEAGKAESLARWEAAAEQTNRRRRDAEDEAKRHAAERDRLTAAIEAVDQRKADALAAADMPVAGLAVTAGGLTLGGVPFGQASQAEQLRAALAIAMRQSPHFRDVWVRQGALLDEDGVDIVRALAVEMDCRVWLEVVGEREYGAIVIRDGQILGAGVKP